MAVFTWAISSKLTISDTVLLSTGRFRPISKRKRSGLFHSSRNQFQIRDIFVAKSPKVIFSANIDGVPRELLSVRQWKGSDLLMVSRHADRLQHPNGSSSLIKNQHYSVHEGSDNQSLTVITQKTEFDSHPPFIVGFRYTCNQAAPFMARFFEAHSLFCGWGPVV